MDNSVIWKIIDSYFRDNPQNLVQHHVESYDDFFKTGIFQIFREKNPVQINTRFDKKLNDYRSKCIMYFGGKDGTKIYFGKPVIYDDANSHYMFPNEARLRNMTYGMTIHYDIDIDFIDILEEGEQPTVIGVQSDDEEEEDTALDIKETSGGAKVKPRETAPKLKVRKQKKQNLLDLTPNETAQLRELTEKSMIESNKQKRSTTLEKIYLGKFPIMVQSSFCVLRGLSPEVRHTMGECKNDIGGYFIIDGKEKTVITQEKFADNMLYVHKVEDGVHLCSAEIRSVSENVSKPIRTLSVKIVAPTPSYTFNNIVVNVPNVRKPVPLFILFRALGVLSDKQIITMCLLDAEKYDNMIDLFVPSVHDAGSIMTQRDALNYIAILTKGKTINHALEILADYFLPHVGEVNFMNKAYYLGYMVKRLLMVHSGMELSIDRDNFKYKRLELVGSLMYDLFREYFNLLQKHVLLFFDKKINLNKSMYSNRLFGLIQEYYREVFRERIVEVGFKKAFKGNWGAQTHTKRIGIVQDLNRLSFNSALSHLRKTNLPLDASVKLVGPRVLHSSQWGFLDPIDTPDGGNIGLHKHLSISSYVSKGVSREPFIKWLREKVDMKLIEDCSPFMLSSMTKIILNGLWAGSVTEPLETVAKIKLFRRNALLPIYTSVTFDIRQNTIFIYSDSGRLCRPIFYLEHSHRDRFIREHETVTGEKQKCDSLKWSDVINKKINDCDFKWLDLTCGFNEKKKDGFHPNHYGIYELDELYENINEEKNPAQYKKFLENKAIIDYIDSSESENALIAMNDHELKTKSLHYTHLEIHESFIFGVMCNMIIFPENNPATRNSFSCGQSKQAVSMYHTNHQVRMDKTAVVLNSGQLPLVKSRYMEHINHEENPYGENAIVAIMIYTGYNVEDAMLVNEGALKRGLLRTTYYSTYESHEEKSIQGDEKVETLFTNIENDGAVLRTKPGYDYSQLDKYGLIREETLINDKTILIGLSSSSSSMKGSKIDASKTPKKGQLGTVDKTFITDSEEGKRIAKVRIREERIPNIGDKMASRSGQKGTIGLVVPEEDMPFTKDGLRPDIIINPHALPSRMTIGQLVECITGKACAQYGAFGDCTAFNNDGSKIGVFGEMLTNAGFHSSGNDILYNGMTGEQISTEIFMGPTYYMRLKHMVKDKINYRPLGPRTALTRQPVSGRANDGGLRIGEMERDVLISHGISDFLRESMMERSDKYKIAICNVSGMISIYNPAKKLFISPMADGPIKFTGSLDGKSMNIENITRYGRDFSIVEVPYSLKLLLQELQTMNIQMRIITEDNIEQLSNMMFSKNIDNLLFSENVSPQTIINDIKKTLMNKEDMVDLPGSCEQAAAPNPSPEYPDTSPAYQPSEISPLQEEDTGSPKYNPLTSEDILLYQPTSPEEPPLFEPTSPEEPPPFEPTSPEEPPPDMEIMTGGKVHYRGDKKPERIWNVLKKGVDFVTINTEDGEGLNQEDKIRVVEPSDLYRQGDYRVNFMKKLPEPSDFQRIPMNHSMSQSIPGGINFAPVIKINNGGSEYTTEPGTETQPKISFGTTEPNIPTVPTEGGIVFKKDIVDSKPQPKQGGGESDNGGSIFTGIKDFIIKKLG
uniref:DNA-directed RNA polymerase n=1 Tax=viral metagenome TaxID=1070528 RepID=A0A6C0B8U5_9ZZZZ